MSQRKSLILDRNVDTQIQATMSASYETKESTADRSKFAGADGENVLPADKFCRFDRWLLASGAKFSKLELRDYGDEVRGCHATCPVEEDEIIIEIPLKCLITVEMGQETEIGQKILSSNIELDAPKHIFLMVFMLLDMKNPSSFFRPYYDILPPTLSNMPIFWQPQELAYLQGSFLLTQIDERKQAIEADYHAICNIAPEFGRLATLDEFKWARMCVCSRNFGLIINGLRTAALVPYADMLNHYRPRETKWQFDHHLQGFTIVAMQGIGNGMQVYDSYGQKCNHRFLLNYGFSVETNVEPDGFCPNEVPVLLQLRNNDPLYDFKCSFFRRESFLPSKRLRVCVAENESFHTMLTFLRIIVADQDDINQLTERSSGHLSGGSGGVMESRAGRDMQSALNEANETRAMRLLEATMKQYLAAYPDSFEKDSDRLANDKHLAPFSNERHAVIQVKGEKAVLNFFLEFSQTVLHLLSIRNSDLYRSELRAVQENTKNQCLFMYIRGNLNAIRPNGR